MITSLAEATATPSTAGIRYVRCPPVVASGAMARTLSANAAPGGAECRERGRRRERRPTQERPALEERKAERDAWRSNAEVALEGLGRAIDAQFASWGFTPTEREVALLLLKGHSHKAIAYATGRSERTVRQHAVAVYDKSGLGGRGELAAFFLEDLILPDEDRGLTRAPRAIAHASREVTPAHREPPAA